MPLSEYLKFTLILIIIYFINLIFAKPNVFASPLFFWWSSLNILLVTLFIFFNFYFVALLSQIYNLIYSLFYSNLPNHIRGIYFFFSILIHLVLKSLNSIFINYFKIYLTIQKLLEILTYSIIVIKMGFLIILLPTSLNNFTNVNCFLLYSNFDHIQIISYLIL